MQVDSVAAVKVDSVDEGVKVAVQTSGPRQVQTMVHVEDSGAVHVKVVVIGKAVNVKKTLPALDFKKKPGKATAWNMFYGVMARAAYRNPTWAKKSGLGKSQEKQMWNEMWQKFPDHEKKRFQKLADARNLEKGAGVKPSPCRRG